MMPDGIGGGIAPRSRASTSFTGQDPYEALEMQLREAKLKKAIEEAKSRPGSGSGSGSGSGLSQDERDRLDRDFRSKEGDKAFERQRALAGDRANSEAQAKADETANLIRLRREASSRGIATSRAIKRAKY